MSGSSARAKSHRQGFAALQSGAYQEAKRILEQALAEHGPHVSIYADLAFAAYLSGDMGSFRLYVEQLEAEFAKAAPKLQEKSRILTLVAISKFSEELGRVGHAIERVEEAVALLGSGNPMDLRVRAQQLRLLASFGRSDEVSVLYRFCMHASESRPQELIECFHALALAETRLFGLKAAWPRVLELAKRGDLQAADLRLCLFDLLEVALEGTDLEASGKILAYLSSHNLTEPDSFEKELLRLADPSIPPASADDFYRWTRVVSPLCHLRLLALEAVREGGNNSEARARLAVQLDSFDHKTRQYLARKWKPAFRSEEPVELQVSPAAQTISCAGKVLHFGSRAQPWDLLKILAENHGESPDHILRALGRRETEAERESLRINLLRLNKKLVAMAGLDWVMRFGKQSVQLHPLVRIKF